MIDILSPRWMLLAPATSPLGTQDVTWTNTGGGLHLKNIKKINEKKLKNEKGLFISILELRFAQNAMYQPNIKSDIDGSIYWVLVPCH